MREPGWFVVCVASYSSSFFFLPYVHEQKEMETPYGLVYTGHDIAYACSRAVFSHLWMHMCFVHPCADSPILVSWNAAAARTQPLLPIWHECSWCEFGCQIESNGCGQLLLHPNQRRRDCQHRDTQKTCAALAQVYIVIRPMWMKPNRLLFFF